MGNDYPRSHTKSINASAYPEIVPREPDSAVPCRALCL